MSNHFIQIKDYYGKSVKVEVTPEVYQVFEDSRKAQERQRNEYRRHRDKRELDDYVLEYSGIHATGPEDLYISHERLGEVFAILETCNPIQRQRFWLHRVCGLSLTEIARVQGCGVSRVKKSVEAVAKKIAGLDRTGGVSPAYK